MRHFGSDRGTEGGGTGRPLPDRNVVGFGIGGDEKRAGPELFREVYSFCAENGLRLTAHAGETAGPESIWGALNLRAERIGHGLTAYQDPDLIQELAQRQIPIEVCVTSNVKTGVCPNLADHPVRRYFDEGLMVTVNTDDPAMFETSSPPSISCYRRISHSATITCANWRAIPSRPPSFPPRRSWNF